MILDFRLSALVCDKDGQQFLACRANDILCTCIIHKINKCWQWSTRDIWHRVFIIKKMPPDWLWVLFVQCLFGLGKACCRCFGSKWLILLATTARVLALIAWGNKVLLQYELQTTLGPAIRLKFRTDVTLLFIFLRTHLRLTCKCFCTLWIHFIRTEYWN